MGGGLSLLGYWFVRSSMRLIKVNSHFRLAITVRVCRFQKLAF